MKTLGKLITLLIMLFPLLVHAVGEPYAQEKLEALNKAGKSTLVVIYADWCATCRAQEKILGELLPTNEFKGIATLRVDFDAQRAVVKSFGVRYQSTLIVFKGGKEVARATGDTSRDSITDLLRKSL